ncbi:MAG: hydroxyacid dehydrogenase [Omnitrophica WOR_2 bacterium]
MIKGLFLLNTGDYQRIYGPQELVEIGQMVELVAPQQTASSIRENMQLLKDVDIIISGWGMANLDEDFLAAAPNLKAVFYGAGSIRYFMTEAAWERGIQVVSAYFANDIPVVEFTLSQILFSLKRGWYYVFTIKRDGKYPPLVPAPGGYGSTVGLVSLGMIGRLVAQRLQTFDVQVIAYDPFTSSAEAASLNVELCSLDQVFQRSDVVSLHTPWLKETEGMITGEHLASMKQGATLINTARGAVINEPEMIQVLRRRPDLYAILDVTYPEPPDPGSPLYTLPNVILTPHTAGAVNNECRRLGRLIAGELKCYVNGQPLKWLIDREKFRIMA